MNEGGLACWSGTEDQLLHVWLSQRDGHSRARTWLEEAGVPVALSHKREKHPIDRPIG